METISIDGNDYDSYGTVAGGDIYFAARLGSTTWTTAQPLTKQQSLVTATRWLNRLSLSWEGAETPEPVVQACFELAILLIDDPTLPSAADSGDNKKRLQAGSASIEFFRPTEGPIIPRVAWQLVSPYVDGGGVEGSGGSEAYGTCQDAEFPDDYDYGDLLRGYP